VSCHGHYRRFVREESLGVTLKRARKSVGLTCDPTTYGARVRPWRQRRGATTFDLMHRAGHSSPVAAKSYQHATKDRDRIIADTLVVIAEPINDAPST